MKSEKIVITVLGILLVISIIVIGYLMIKINENSKKNSINIEYSEDAIMFKYNYERLNGKKNSDGNVYNTLSIAINNPIKYVNLEELVNIIDTEDGIIYISSPTCPYCRATVETLLQVVKDLNISKIYYYEIFTGNEVANYDELMKELEEKEIVKVNNDSKYSWGVPVLLQTRNGEIISKINGVSYELEENQSKYDSLNEEQKEIVYNRYYDALNK